MNAESEQIERRLTDALEAFVSRHGLQDAIPFAGFSGGVDSTALLLLLHRRFPCVQAIHFHLDINGKTVQEGCSSEMLYKVDELIAYISQYFTLKTGDLLYTGTPVGVGPVHIDDHVEGWLEDRKVLEFNCK